MAGKRIFNTEEAAEIAAIFTARKAPKHVIKKALRAQFKSKVPISARTIERILARAREINLVDSGKTRKELRTEAHQVYNSVIYDPEAKATEVLRAQELKDKLFGLPMTRVIHSGTGEGGAIKTESKTTVEVLAEKVKTFDFEALRTAMRPQVPVSDAANN